MSDCREQKCWLDYFIFNYICMKSRLKWWPLGVFTKPVWGSRVPTCGSTCSWGTLCVGSEKPRSYRWASPTSTTSPKWMSHPSSLVRLISVITKMVPFSRTHLAVTHPVAHYFPCTLMEADLRSRIIHLCKTKKNSDSLQLLGIEGIAKRL